MVAQEPAVLTRKLHGIFMDIFVETCDHTHGMKWDTVHITWRLWIEPIILLKSNHYIKCFCQPECCQYKILTGSLAYCLALPPHLSGIHNVFHVLALRKYVIDPSYVLEVETIPLRENLSYKEVPVRIVDRKENDYVNDESQWLK
jgi:hypothetical protein